MDSSKFSKSTASDGENRLSGRVRRLDILDYELIENLTNSYTEQLFGEVDLKNLLSVSLYSIGWENKEGDIIALLMLNCYPNVPAIAPTDWEEWIRNVYYLTEPTPMTTLFIHYVAFQSGEATALYKNLLTDAFYQFENVKYIFLVTPPKCYSMPWVKENGTTIKAKDFYSPNKIQCLQLMVRKDYTYRYIIRKAVEEDNDDLVPLIDAYAKSFKEFYGDFYISTIIRQGDASTRHILVAEYQESPAAVIFLNKKINYKLLNVNFDLACFHGLRKPKEFESIVAKEGVRILSTIKVQSIKGEEDDIAPCSSKSTEINVDQKNPRGILFNIEEEEQSKKPSDSEEGGSSYFSLDISDSFSIISPSTSDSNEESDFETNEGYFSAILLNTTYTDVLTRKTRTSLVDMEKKLTPITEGFSSTVQVNMPMKHWQFQFEEEGNAFAVEVIATKPGHEYAVRDLIRTAFQCFPNRDYCILTIPTKEMYVHFLSYFVKAVPHAEAFFQHELYICARCSMMGQLSVRPVEFEDLDVLEELLANVSKPLAIFNSILNYFYEPNSKYKIFVFDYEDFLFGVAILRPERDIDFLKTHYIVRKWENFEYKKELQGRLEYCCFSPVFGAHWNFLLREIHRQSDFSIIYYVVTPEDGTSQRVRSLSGILGYLLQAPPIQRTEYHTENLNPFAPKPTVTEERAPFALFLSTMRHITIPRYTVNQKIVVVGASNVATSFLLSLMSAVTPYYKIIFTNVSLVSPHSISLAENELRDRLFVAKSNRNCRTMSMNSLRTYVNLVFGAMTKIDRTHKRITINDCCYLHYDYLFLFCGEQYQGPNVEALIPASDDKETRKKANFGMPKNVFIINTELDAHHALGQLKSLIHSQKKKIKYTIVIYGYSLEVYCCMATLLDMGVPGANITYIEWVPPQKDYLHSNYLLFNNVEVEDAVLSYVEENGINVLSEFELLDWNVDEKKNLVTSIRFESRHKLLELDCLCFFMYAVRSVSQRTIMAIGNAGLVFDGKLVINNQCQTNDPSIYAAGSFTKYSRRYFADHLSHCYFNNTEIGQDLGRRLRLKLTSIPDEIDTALIDLHCSNENLVPIYKDPLMTFCTFPGGLSYLYIRKPGKPVPLEVARDDRDYGWVAETGNLKNLDEKNYFRLHFNTYNVVETITCLSKQKLDRINIYNLWGKHESMLNNFKVRFHTQLIDDLYDYFREPWTYAIYNHHFEQLEQSTLEYMQRQTKVSNNSLIEDIVTLCEKNKYRKFNKEEFGVVVKKFVNSPYHQSIKRQLMDFLLENIEFLPMYAQPMLVKLIMEEYENSPLFSKNWTDKRPYMFSEK